MKVTLIGSGNLATCLGRAVVAAGHEVVQVWSRTRDNAAALGSELGCPFTDDLAEVLPGSDIYIVSVKDTALDAVVRTLPAMGEESILVHTAGSMPMDALAVSSFAHIGVMYPMQTFSKARQVDFTHIPIFTEGSDTLTTDRIEALAGSLSQSVVPLSSADRRCLHVAAVFACNFTNHCYDIASRILEPHGIPFSVMLPLIDETARKVHHLAPVDAQTGPAIRYDQSVMERHLSMLDDDALREIYRLMSDSIHRRFQKK